MKINDLAGARALDAQDPLTSLKQRFHFPKKEGGCPVYFCGNSLGLQPLSTREHILAELDHWAHFGVDGHFEGERSWFSYHEPMQAPMAAVVGALDHEVVVMGSLTDNLHRAMVSFYRPTQRRYRILIEASAFPSDKYAVDSQAHFHGYDPRDAVVRMQPREGETLLRTEDIEAYLASPEGEKVALVMFGGVNYYTGQAFDMERITKAAHEAGAVAGFDLAHAAGNLKLELHDWDVDFAVWCSYKYLNSGPGGVAGLFVHDRHALSPELPRFAGWWGNDPATRFKMSDEFSPQRGAAGWQLSNAPILPMAALHASLEIFSEVGMAALRERSVRLSGALLELVQAMGSERFEVISPLAASERGCQLSIRTMGDGQALFARLSESGVVCDFREPDVIRVAPVPLYNTFEDVFRFAQILEESNRA